MSFRPADNPRTVRLHVRMTTAEKSELEAHAEAAGLTASAYLRRRAFGHAIASKVDVNAVAELKRLGGLLKLALKQRTLLVSQHRELLILVRGAIAQVVSRG